MLQAASTRETRLSATELKFLVSPSVGAEIHAWSRSRLAPDPHATGDFDDQYRTSTLYFDTEQLDVYRRRGSFGRSKYRVRRYGGSGVVFLERKLRTATMLVKRRTPIGIDELRLLAEPGRESGWAGDWFKRRLIARRLGPTCQIFYQRIARVGMTAQGPMRLTIDRDIRARPATSLEFLPGDGTRILETEVVVELKFRAGLPVLFRHLVEEFRLAPTAVSKYRVAVAALGGPVGEDARAEDGPALRTAALPHA